MQFFTPLAKCANYDVHNPFLTNLTKYRPHSIHPPIETLNCTIPSCLCYTIHNLEINHSVLDLEITLSGKINAMKLLHYILKQIFKRSIHSVLNRGYGLVMNHAQVNKLMAVKSHLSYRRISILIRKKTKVISISLLKNKNCDEISSSLEYTENIS